GAVLLTLAAVADRLLPRLLPAARELMWRSALFGALLTATLQIAGQHAPLGGRVMFAAPPVEQASASVVAANSDNAASASAAPSEGAKPAAAPSAKSTPAPADRAPLSTLLTRAFVAQPSDTPVPRAPFPWTLALWLIWALGAQFGVFRFALAWTRWQ